MHTLQLSYIALDAGSQHVLSGVCGLLHADCAAWCVCRDTKMMSDGLRSGMIHGKDLSVSYELPAACRSVQPHPATTPTLIAILTFQADAHVWQHNDAVGCFHVNSSAYCAWRLS